jgi:hypothetical protein
MRSAFLWGITQPILDDLCTQRQMVILHRRFGSTYRFQLRRSRSQRIIIRRLRNTLEERPSPTYCRNLDLYTPPVIVVGFNTWHIILR